MIKAGYSMRSLRSPDATETTGYNSKLCHFAPFLKLSISRLWRHARLAHGKIVSIARCQAKVTKDCCDKGRPTGLMTCANTAPRIAVEVFVVEWEVAPVRIAGISLVISVARAPTRSVRQK